VHAGARSKFFKKKKKKENAKPPLKSHCKGGDTILLSETSQQAWQKKSNEKRMRYSPPLKGKSHRAWENQFNPFFKTTLGIKERWGYSHPLSRDFTKLQELGQNFHENRLFATNYGRFLENLPNFRH
jgi:hypothetical protein